MITESKLKIMQAAYGLMYEVENSLRKYIKQEMNKSFGPHWFQIAPRIVLKRPPSKTFDSLLFYEYERLYLRTYSKVFEALSEEFYKHLHVLYPLRNKVAHCHDLCEREFKDLTFAQSFLVSYLKRRV